MPKIPPPATADDDDILLLSPSESNAFDIMAGNGSRLGTLWWVGEWAGWPSTNGEDGKIVGDSVNEKSAIVKSIGWWKCCTSSVFNVVIVHEMGSFPTTDSEESEEWTSSSWSWWSSPWATSANSSVASWMISFCSFAVTASFFHESSCSYGIGVPTEKHVSYCMQ